ncbi:MAG: hypothetical protein JO191_07370 [Mycobacteriaceae bacterium]|nr:hypothetical protein [Mycobacteriaceae bacterium]
MDEVLSTDVIKYAVSDKVISIGGTDKDIDEIAMLAAHAIFSYGVHSMYGAGGAWPTRGRQPDR